MSAAGPGPRTFRLRWAECRRPLRLAALALWLPTLAPFAIGPLRECSHCVQTYWSLVPILPGFVGAAWCRDSVLAMYALGVLCTLCIVALLALAIALLGRHWPWAALVAGALSGGQAIALGHLLRM